MELTGLTLRDTLQTVRKSRRISQLELAMRMGVSQRHVSFVESGRSQPSRELLLSWLHELEAPLALRNVALHQAGFARVYSDGELGDTVLAPVREALSRLLTAHNPFPAMVLDASWNIVEMNQGAQWLAATLMPSVVQFATEQPLNLLDALLLPDGMTKYLVNFEEVAPALLAHLREDARMVPRLVPKVELLAQLIQQRLGKKSLPAWPTQTAPVLTSRYVTPVGELAFFSMFSTFGTPQNITLASLRVEHMFPADEATRTMLMTALV